jgi:hypothetical protein
VDSGDGVCFYETKERKLKEKESTYVKKEARKSGRRKVEQQGGNTEGQGSKVSVFSCHP